MGGRAGAGSARLLRAAAVGALMLFAAACSPIERIHGYAPTDAELAEIVVGADTRDTVAEVVGRPSAAGLLNDEGWYYVESRFRTIGPREPKEVDRQVVAISFDPDGVVANVERFGLEDGRVVALSRRVTEQNVRGFSFLRQLFQSFGRFNAGDFLE